MKYLLFLNRFEIDKDKLKGKIKNLDKSTDFKDEDDKIIIDTKINPEDLLNFQEISKIIALFNYWKDFNFKTLKEDCLDLVKRNNIKEYFIETKFYSKVPISAKSIYKHINPYLKYDGFVVNEEGDVVYLEFKKFNNELKYRLGFCKRNLFKVNLVKVDMSKFVVIMENPGLALEVSDFLRLCWIFKLPLYIITNDKINFEKILKKAKEETKGIEYDKFELKIVSELPKGFTYCGFSKHANMNEKDMKNIILKEDRIALVFGDDKFGLTQETRDKLNHTFRLTPETKKPLRASQALSYVLGFYTASSI